MAKHFETYSDAARATVDALEIRVKTADLRREQFDPQWVYMNRIGSKTRILSAADVIHNGGRIRSAIKVTWNPDRYSTDELRRYIAARLFQINRLKHGTCHQCIRCSETREVLAGIWDDRTRFESDRNILHTATEQWAKRQAAKIH